MWTMAAACHCMSISFRASDKRMTALQGGGGRSKAAAFTREELRRLFRLDTATACETAALLRPAAATGEWEVRGCTHPGRQAKATL